jgi:hypothetical protein
VGEYVHESVRVTGGVGHLKYSILHFTCSSLSEHLKSMDRYTTLAAQEVVAHKQAVTWTRLVMDPIWTFSRSYFFQRGFLDGVEGLSIAWMAGLYTYLKYAKARYMRGE